MILLDNLSLTLLCFDMAFFPLLLLDRTGERLLLLHQQGGEARRELPQAAQWQP